MTNESTTLTPEALSKARDRALDLTQPLCRITDCVDRASEVADELFRLASRALALSHDLRAQSASADAQLSHLCTLLGIPEETSR